MRKLGKKEARHVAGALKLSKYLAPELVTPGKVEWALNESAWQMLGNDTIGDCTTACSGHIILEEEFQNGQPPTVEQACVIKAYSAVSGYVPGDPSTDNGAYIDDVLSYWKKTGICGNKIAGYVSVDQTNLSEIRAAVYIFGNIDLGVQLPATAQTQVDNNEIWALTEGYQNDPNAQPGSWGGHCVPIIGYRHRVHQATKRKHWNLKCVTWGATQLMTWSWLAYYADEAWAVLDESWLSPSKLAPNGLNLTQLQADLASI